MKRVFASQDQAAIAIVRELLANEGIETVTITDQQNVSLPVTQYSDSPFCAGPVHNNELRIAMNDKRASRKGRAIIVATLLVVLFVLAILSDSEHRKQYGTLETIGYSVLGLVGTLVIVGWFAYRWLGIKISRNDGSQSNDSDALAMKETEAEKLLSKATKLETQGRLPEAVNAYEQFITEHPESEMVGDAKTCLNSLKKKIKN